MKHSTVPLATKTIDLTCPFRDDSRRICTIYAARPLICREYRCDKTAEDAEREVDHKLRRRIVYMREYFFGNEEAQL